MDLVRSHIVISISMLLVSLVACSSISDTADEPTVSADSENINSTTPVAEATPTTIPAQPAATSTRRGPPTRPIVIDSTPTGVHPDNPYSEYEIITVLGKDAIPAIYNPQFLTAEEADGLYLPDELVLGVTFNGQARAYSIPLLSRHEIVNDTVGGVPIAVTW